MAINIENCDLNEDYFHFTNKKNIESILNNGLIPAIGPASQLVGDKENVSLSQGAKGMMGIINSFVYVFSNEKNISEIPDTYRKYFEEIEDFSSKDLIDKEIVYKAFKRKLKDEVYFRVKLDKEDLKNASFGGLTNYDITLKTSVAKENLDIIIDSNNNILSAYDILLNIYQKAKDIDVLRSNHEDFFYMFEQDDERNNRISKGR